MVVPTKPLAEVTQNAIRVLCREIGLADTMRVSALTRARLSDSSQASDSRGSHLAGEYERAGAHWHWRASASASGC